MTLLDIPAPTRTLHGKLAVTRQQHRDAGVSPLLPVVGADLQVPLVDGRAVRYANLDNAASTQPLQAVAARLAEVTPYYSSVHRGAGWASQVSTALYESCRGVVADFVGAREDDVVVFTRHTTESLNLLASAVPLDEGDVVLLDLEHHANLLPWQRGAHRVLPVASTLQVTLERIETALQQRPTALLAITGSSNVTGEVLPIRRLADLAHRYGARIAVDAAQLAPHRRIDLAATGVDYVAFSGHKLYAPYGAGVLVGRRDWLDAAEPHLAGGGAVREVTVSGTEWAAAPARHEGGTPNVLGAVALAAACRELQSLPAGTQEAHEAALSLELLDGLYGVSEVTVHRIWPGEDNAIGVVTFSVAGFDAGLVAAYLSAEHGIGVRDGRFCAHPLLNRLGVGEAVRASLGVGSRSEDVQRLVAALHQLVNHGPSVEYEKVEGRWTPVADPRALPSWLDAPTAPAGASPCDS